MKTIHAIGCKGLADPLVGMPLELLLAYLNQETGIFFNLVGGLDPHPLFEVEILQPALQAHARGETIVFVGHSMGGMACFYLADRLKRSGVTSPLFVGIDATNWASNAPDVAPWTRPATTPPAGHWYAPDNIDRMLYFHQDAGPGGGVAFLAHGNTHTKLSTYHMPQESHLSIVNAAGVRTAIVEALNDVKKL
jgi:pimeloyl-ACP methyl ester carboxylesterase